MCDAGSAIKNTSVGAAFGRECIAMGDMKCKAEDRHPVLQYSNAPSLSGISIHMKSSSSKGFTLLEILLAIAILGVAVTVIMQQFSAGLRISRTSRTYTTATIYAKQILEEYLLAEEMEEGEASGTFDDGYAWNVSIEAYEDYKEEEGATEEEQELYEHLPLEMFRIEAVVSWMEGGRENSVALATLKTVKKIEEEKM